MGRCIVCGKHGLFLKVKAGLCADCAYSKNKDVYIGARRAESVVTPKAIDRPIEHFEAAQSVYRTASSYAESIKAMRSETAPWKDPFGPKINTLISLCYQAIAFYPQIMSANKLTGESAESTLCVFPAAECLVEIYLHRKWYDKAFGVINRLEKLDFVESYNVEKVNLLSRRIAHEQNVSENYPYSMDECICMIRDRIATESIACVYPGSSRQFTRTHFNDMCDRFGLRNDPQYCINSAFQSNPQYVPKPRYKYTDDIIDHILEKIEADSRILVDIHSPD